MPCGNGCHWCFTTLNRGSPSLTSQRGTDGPRRSRTSWRHPTRTPENAGSPWLLFEAGALAKSMQGARVIPLLFDLSRSFKQRRMKRSAWPRWCTRSIKASTMGFPRNAPNTSSRPSGQRSRRLLSSVPPEPPTQKHMRPQHGIIEELVTGVRGLDSRFRDLETVVSDPDVGLKAASGAALPPHDAGRVQPHDLGRR
jgi:hypothetical protein